LAVICAAACPTVRAQDAPPEPVKALQKNVETLQTAAADAKKGVDDARVRGDTAWMLTSSAFVMLMLPGLALFYGGMVRRKNVLSTMMHSMAALAVVGLYWVVVGYGLAFGPSWISLGSHGGLIGWSWDLVFLKGVGTDQLLPGSNMPVYAHVMFQGMFAIITPALISGALAERIRFWPFCLFVVLWVTFVYCPLAHMVWAADWFTADPVDAAKGLGGSPIGLLAGIVC
jgi:ammonia channel protein AmtB